MCLAGKGVVAANLVLSAYEVKTASEPDKKAASIAARLAGAYVGGKIGALTCGWGGPWGAGICSIIGAGIGAAVGEEAINELQSKGSVSERISDFIAESVYVIFEQGGTPSSNVPNN